MLRMAGLQDRLTKRVAEQEPKRGLLRQNRHLDRIERPQISPSRREQDSTDQGRRYTARCHRSIQYGRFREIVQDQQDLRRPTQLFKRRPNLLVARAVQQFGTKPAAQRRETLHKRLYPIDPEGAPRVRRRWR